MGGDLNNVVAEWFGHVVWPAEEVDSSTEAVKNQTQESCPFLGAVLGEETLCVKKKKLIEGVIYRTGFCTQSSTSSGRREDWLACPNRVFGVRFDLLAEGVRLLFGIGQREAMSVLPITRVREWFDRAHFPGQQEEKPGRRFVFAANPSGLGGEVDIPATKYSSASKVDVTISEWLGVDGAGMPVLGSPAIFEIQTADFHGSPLHAIGGLRRIGPPGRLVDYHPHIAVTPDALSDRLEGPNKANIFKRTIYQMLVKIRMAAEAETGFCLVLPEPVWRSWAAHLGGPDVVNADDGLGHRLVAPTRQGIAGSGGTKGWGKHVASGRAWIVVFRIDRSSAESPRPLEVVYRISTSAPELSQFAFEMAPELGVEEGAMKRYSLSMMRRLKKFW